MVKLTKVVHKKLKDISERLDMPMAQVVNMLINDWLKNNNE